MIRLLSTLSALVLVSFNALAQAPTAKPAAPAASSATAAPASAATAKAIFAGGCFWCMEPPFDKTEGVISTTSGYIGGPKQFPTYEDGFCGRSRHRRSSGR